MTLAILQPVITLVLWSMVMWGWLYATRIPAMMSARTRLDPTLPRDVMLGGLPPRVRWKADNYNHLFEMPTVFYPTVLVLALLGPANPSDLALAWAYVGLRVVHSLVQALVNIIELRFVLFVSSSLVLLALVVRALGAVLG
jgi:hypothetical protein